MKTERGYTYMGCENRSRKRAKDPDMDFQTASAFGFLSQNEIIVLVLLAPILLGVYLGLKAW